MIETYRNINPRIADTAWVHPSACVIGQVILEKNVSVWPMVVIRGDVNCISIGEGSNIQDLSMLHVSHDGPIVPGGASLSIGAQVTVGHKVMLHGCEIHDNVLVGMNAVVMDKAVVESNVIIGAGTLVPAHKRLHSGLWLGQPAKWIRDLTTDEIEQIAYSAKHYQRLMLTYIT